MSSQAFPIDLTRRLYGALFQNLRDRVDSGIYGRDPRQVRAHDFNSSNLPNRNRVSQFARGQTPESIIHISPHKAARIRR
jgi:hypothetical protein